MNLPSGIKRKIIYSLGTNDVKFEKFGVPSKNVLMKVFSGDRTFLLKIYLPKKEGYINHHREFLKSYDREVSALKFFSSRLEEVPKMVLAGKNKEYFWLMKEFFEGIPLKDKVDKRLYKRVMDVMVRMHSLTNIDKNHNKIEIIQFYDEKVQEIKERLKLYLPKKLYKYNLNTFLDNFYLCYPFILDSSNKIIHGDFVDRNILIKGSEIKLVDFENSRFAPVVEDLIFFIQSIKVDQLIKNELISYYKDRMHFTSSDDRILTIIQLFTTYRYLGSLLRIKHKKITEYEERIIRYIREIEKLVRILREEHKIDLFQKHQETWDQTYTSKGKFFKEVHPLLKTSITKLSKNYCNVLDLGSGSGRHIIFLAKKGFNVTGIDNSKKGIELTKETLKKLKLSAKLIVSDIYKKLPFKDNSFDLVISTQVIHHNRTHQIRDLVREIERILKFKGKIFITMPKIKDLSYKNPIEVEKNTFIPLEGNERGVTHHYFSRDELSQLFHNFSIEIFEDRTKHYVIIGTKIKKSISE